MKKLSVTWTDSDGDKVSINNLTKEEAVERVTLLIDNSTSAFSKNSGIFIQESPAQAKKEKKPTLVSINPWVVKDDE